jgi:recombination endonuclease VII
MPERTWTCRRVKDGRPCAHVNPARKRNCETCGKPRQRRQTSRDRHMAGKEAVTYEQAIAINGGEFCGVCGTGPGTRRLHKDHEHKGDGAVRGLLCFRCNAALRTYMTLDWLLAAAAYLYRFEQRRGVATNGDTKENHA